MPSNIVKDFSMSKNKSASTDKEPTSALPASTPAPTSDPTSHPTSSRRLGLIFARIILWAIFLLVIGYLWLRPEIVYNIVGRFSQPTPVSAPQSQDDELISRLRRLNNRLSELEHRLNQAEPAVEAAPSAEIAQLNERLTNFEKQNISLLDAKADSATVLGLVNRLDKLEQRLDNMAKISDQGALILTTVMMIKDASARGNTFPYEAEVLSQLGNSEPDLQAPISEILRFAHRRLPSAASLTADFDNLYNTISKAEQDKAIASKDWKERLNMKLSEYVSVKRTDQAEADIPQQPDTMLSAKNDVDKQEFSAALSILTQPENQALRQEYPELDNWINAASEYTTFHQAIGQISTYSLALMKLNYVHPKNNNLNQ